MVVVKSEVKAMVKEKNMRVSAEAMEHIEELVTNYLDELISQASDIAKYCKRKTIKKEDLTLAKNKL
jgi:histone H3/H4